MDDAPIIRKYTSFDEMKADEYRYWQSRPAHERLDAVEEMIKTAYAIQGWEIEPDVPRLQRPLCGACNVRRNAPRYPFRRLRRPRQFLSFWTGSERRRFLPDLPGVDFDAAWERRVECVIDPASGLKANFISVARPWISAARFPSRQDIGRSYGILPIITARFLCFLG
jgi:hypothetical protein